jgi:hypothetical protein
LVLCNSFLSYLKQLSNGRLFHKQKRYIIARVGIAKPILKFGQLSAG